MAKSDRSRPGVMLYFDSIRPALDRLDDLKCGQLFRAIVDYAEYGAVPKLDPLVGMVFALLVPKIDRDAEKYAESREQRQHAVYVREAKRRGEQPMTISEWRIHRELSSDIEPISPDIEKIGSYPSTTISSTPSVSSSITPSSTTSGEGEGKEEREGCRGEEEGNDLPPPSYQQPSEVDFEKMRSAALAKLEGRR